MNTNTDIQEELKGMGSPLAGMSQKTPFVVPDNYFDNFGPGISATIKEIENERPLFAGGKLISPGAIPEGYFNSLPERMLEMARLKDTPKQKTIAFNPKPARKATFSVRWAAAAVIIITIGIGSYGFLFSTNETGTDKLLSSVPNKEIHDYLENTYQLDVDKIVSSSTILTMPLDNKDIIKYLDETGWDVVD
jgi:hypothetical protein